jgi:hypothetical protein
MAVSFCLLSFYHTIPKLQEKANSRRGGSRVPIYRAVYSSIMNCLQHDLRSAHELALP